MTIKKFGLAELERYATEVGFKKSDVRTIKGVCAIVELPLTIVPEAQEIIVACGKDIVNSEKRIVKVRDLDAKDNEETKAGIARLKDERKVTKSNYEQTIAASRVETGNSNGEIDRLEKLLKRFS